MPVGKKLNITAAAIAALFVLSLVPMLILAFYNHPSADDYSFGINTARAWRDTGSLWEVAKAAGQTVGIYYDGWQGTWSAIFLFTLQPDAFGGGYWFTAFLMPGAFCTSALLLSRELLIVRLGASRAEWAIISLLPLSMMIHRLPSATQAFFWWNGAMFYTFFYSLTLIYLTLLLRLQRDGTKSAVAVAGASVLGAVIGGGSFPAAMLAFLCSAAFIGISALNKDKRALRLVCPFLLLLGGLIVNIAAPGNAIRAQNFEGMGPAGAIARSFMYGAGFCVKWMTVETICVILLTLPFIYSAVKRSGLPFRYPAAVSALSFCIYSSVFTPSLYAMGVVGPDRLLNVGYYAFWWLVLLNIAYWCGWLCKRVKQMPFLRRAAVPAAAVVLAVFAVFAYRSRTENTAWLSLHILRNGEAAAYSGECRERRAVLIGADGGHVTVKPIRTRPRPLFLADFADDPAVWPNTAVAMYYDLDSVTLGE
jgi:hypothetical protein